MLTKSEDESDYTMESLTWDSPSETKLGAKETIQVSAEARSQWCVCGQRGQGGDEGKGVPGDARSCD